MMAFQMWRLLFDRGIFTTPVVSPAVPENRALIRVSVMATFSQRHITMALEVFAEVGRILSVIPGEPIERGSNPELIRNRVRKWMKRLWRLR